MTTPIASPSAAPGPNTSRLETRANLEAAGRRFEAVFDGMMLKAMRQAKLADDLFDSKALDTFREMQDQQVAKSMSENAPIGIGKAMVDFLAKSQGSLQAPDVPSADLPPVASGDAAGVGSAS